MKTTSNTIARAATAAVLLVAAQAAQAQSSVSGDTQPTVRGDRQTSIITQVQRNVPKAQRNDQTSRFRPGDPLAGDDKPDVLLDIPNVSVDEIKLEVQNLQAHVSLDTRVANLVKIAAGVDVTIDNVKLEIKGVKASALLIVRLENVREMVTRALDTLDKNPDLVERLQQTADKAPEATGPAGKGATPPGRAGARGTSPAPQAAPAAAAPIPAR